MQMSKVIKKLSVFIITFVFALCLFAFQGSAASVSKKISVESYASSCTTVKVKWKTDYKYKYYLVYRAEEKGSFKKIAKITKKAYTDKKLTPNKTYSYKIVGVKGDVKYKTDAEKVNTVAKVTPYANYEDKDDVVISWEYSKKNLKNIDGFYVYRKGPGDKSFAKIGSLSKKGYLIYLDGVYTFSYYDTSSKKLNKIYYYKVIPYSAKKKGASDKTSILIEPYMYLTTKENSIKVKWTSYPGAESYKLFTDIYKLNPDGYFSFLKSKVYDLPATQKSYTVKKDTKKYIYQFWLEAFDKNGNYLGSLNHFSNVSSSYPAVMRTASEDESRKEIEVINVRGEEPVIAWTETLSENDIKLFRNFEKLHFQKGMTKAQKASYMHSWIHYNVDYDYDYIISDKYSYAEAILKYKTGQCLQYNGTLVHYLAYLGYNSRIIMGYRGQSVNHFWGEINAAGQWNCMETGNYKKNGGYWSNFCRSYNNGATNYNICGNIT